MILLQRHNPGIRLYGWTVCRAWLSGERGQNITSIQWPENEVAHITSHKDAFRLQNRSWSTCHTAFAKIYKSAQNTSVACSKVVYFLFSLYK